MTTMFYTFILLKYYHFLRFRDGEASEWAAACMEEGVDGLFPDDPGMFVRLCIQFWIIDFIFINLLRDSYKAHVSCTCFLRKNCIIVLLIVDMAIISVALQSSCLISIVFNMPCVQIFWFIMQSEISKFIGITIVWNTSYHLLEGGGDLIEMCYHSSSF